VAATASIGDFVFFLVLGILVDCVVLCGSWWSGFRLCWFVLFLEELVGSKIKKKRISYNRTCMRAFPFTLRHLHHRWRHANAHERARALQYPKKGRDSIVVIYSLDIVVQYYNIQWICNY
jgi:hypothetical protein